MSNEEGILCCEDGTYKFKKTGEVINQPAFLFDYHPTLDIKATLVKYGDVKDILEYREILNQELKEHRCEDMLNLQCINGDFSQELMDKFMSSGDTLVKIWEENKNVRKIN